MRIHPRQGMVRRIAHQVRHQQGSAEKPCRCMTNLIGTALVKGIFALVF